MPNNLRKIRTSLGLTLKDFAKKIGVELSTYEHWEKERRGIKKQYLQKISDETGFSSDYILGLTDSVNPFAPEKKIKVPVIGYIGAGAEVYTIDDSPKGQGIDEVDCPPNMNPSYTVALKVKGNSMYPALREGWLVFYSREVYGMNADCEGNICVVETDAGKTLVKEVRKGSKKGTYNLISYNSPVMHDVKLKWCAKIRYVEQV